MQTQIKPSVTNPTVATIFQDIESRKLILAPDFQRRFVWTHEHQEDFIETIIKGYPFPEIYVCQGEIDTRKLKTTQYVIDGQQRLTTIKNYIDGVSHKEFKKIPNFDDLNEEDRALFLSYQIVVRDIGQVAENDIKEIFRRINLTKFKLEDIEIHNAIYDGHFIRTSKEVLENIDLTQFNIFSDSEFSRMADVHFILLVMSTLENRGYFPLDKEVEQYIAKFNDEYLNKNHIKALIIKTFAIINDINLPVESIWFRKSNFFTLVIEIARNIEKIPDNLANQLIQFEIKIIEDKYKDNDFGLYYRCMSSGTNHRKSRVERARIFNQYIYQ